MRLLCRLGRHSWQPLRAPGDGGWYKKCRVCGKRHTDEALQWFPIVISLIVVAAGVIVALTYGSLIGPLLVLGGVGVLGVTALPAAFERLGLFLSTGTARRKPKG